MNHESLNMPQEGDPLDALLRNADEYISDDGFTARVVQNLPARRSRRWRRFTVLSAALLIGAALVAWQAPAMLAAFNSSLSSPSLLDWKALFGSVPLLAALGSLGWVLFAVATDEH
jgi:hypothetical protein